MARIFDNAHDFRFNDLTVNEHPANALEKLEALIAPEALHDSAERCDSPKCDPETRVAVQGDLYSWIEHGDPVNPIDMKWVTGPAGSGKTAIMGSITERCKENGITVVSFFFSSLGSIGRRTKTAFVTTIAYQLTQHRQDLKDAIAAAIEVDTIVFKKNLRVQMETLVLAPLRAVAGPSNTPLRGVFVIDGLDECGVEQMNVNTTTGLSTLPTRTKEQDQLEILQVLHQASSDPTFPFRIIIASRPERVFRWFFDPEGQPVPIAQKIDLHESYNADADITLFLEAHFNRLRRLHELTPSWLPPNAIQILVGRASGQFIYAATVIRFLELGHREPPKDLLEAILMMKATATFNPLDVLYSFILNSSPDPLLSVQWIRIIDLFLADAFDSHRDTYISTMYCPALIFRLLLQTDPESNEAEHLLGNLHSLIRIPPHAEQATATYAFYHKSLLDFLQDPDRCGKLHIQRKKTLGFLWERFHGVCATGCDKHFSYPEDLLEFLSCLPYVKDIGHGIAHSEVLPTPAGADWWLSLTVPIFTRRLSFRRESFVQHLFRKVHESCSWYHCTPACRIWSRSILRRLGSFASIAPGVLWPGRHLGFQRKRFLSLLDKAEEDSQSLDDPFA